MQGAKRVLAVCWAFLCLLCTGCTYSFDGYDGEYPQLYSVAIDSIPDARGYYPDPHGPWQPRLQVMETDAFGRVLFCYCEDETGQALYLLVMQKADVETAYYYAEKNHIVADVSNGYMFGYGNEFELALAQGFTDQEKQDLKKQNDWGKEIDLSRCVRVKIVRKKA